jgi:hypothetical protein
MLERQAISKMERGCIANTVSTNLERKVSLALAALGC